MDNIKQSKMAGSGTNAIIKRIEGARNKEAVIEEYRKMVKNLGEEYKNWISDNTDDILDISYGIEALQKNLEKIAQDFIKTENIVDSLKKTEESSRTKISNFAKASGVFNKLMNMNLDDLIADQSHLLYDPTPTGSNKDSRFDFKDSAANKLSEVQTEHEEADLQTLEVTENIEKLEVAILQKDLEKGIHSLSILHHIDQASSRSFYSFATYNKYRELKVSFFQALEESLEVGYPYTSLEI